MSTTETAEPIEVSFGGTDSADCKEQCIRWGPHPPGKEQLGGNMSGSLQTIGNIWQVVDILNLIRYVAAVMGSFGVSSAASMELTQTSNSTC